MQVIVEKAERSDVPDIDKKKLVIAPFHFKFFSLESYESSCCLHFLFAANLSYYFLFWKSFCNTR